MSFGFPWGLSPWSKAHSDTRSVVLQWGKIRHPASRRIFGVKFYVSCVIFVMIFPQSSKISEISRFVLKFDLTQNKSQRLTLARNLSKNSSLFTQPDRYSFATAALGDSMMRLSFSEANIGTSLRNIVMKITKLQCKQNIAKSRIFLRSGFFVKFLVEMVLQFHFYQNDKPETALTSRMRRRR